VSITINNSKTNRCISIFKSLLSLDNFVTISIKNTTGMPFLPPKQPDIARED
jgi:hypothetical protein